MTDIEKICREVNIDNDFVSAKPMDKENRIFKNDDLIVKLYYERKYPFFYNERKVYTSLNGNSYLPKYYTSGEMDNFKYIIIEKLNGTGLFDVWDNLDIEEQKNIIKQISIILKDINNIDSQYMNFIKEFRDSFLKDVEIMQDSSKKDYFISTFDKLSNNFNDIEKCNLIHIDVHFYNFMYDNGNIKAYDFENMTYAPLDYQLIRWYRMWKYPEDYYYPKNSLSQKQIDKYKLLMPELLDNYSNIKNIKNLKNRLMLYELSYLVKEINRCKLSDSEIKKYIKEAKETDIYG